MGPRMLPCSIEKININRDAAFPLIAKTVNFIHISTNKREEKLRESEGRFSFHKLHFNLLQ